MVQGSSFSLLPARSAEQRWLPGVLRTHVDLLLISKQVPLFPSGSPTGHSLLGNQPKSFEKQTWSCHPSLAQKPSPGPEGTGPTFSPVA